MDGLVKKLIVKFNLKLLISQRNSLNDSTLGMICMEKILFITDAENQQKFLIKNYL